MRCKFVSVFFIVASLSSSALLAEKLVLWDAIKSFQWEHARTIVRSSDVDINLAPTEGEYKGVSPILLAANLGQWNLVRLMLDFHPQTDVDMTPETYRSLVDYFDIEKEADSDVLLRILMVQILKSRTPRGDVFDDLRQSLIQLFEDATIKVQHEGVDAALRFLRANTHRTIHERLLLAVLHTFAPNTGAAAAIVPQTAQLTPSLIAPTGPSSCCSGGCLIQ